MLCHQTKEQNAKPIKKIELYAPTIVDGLMTESRKQGKHMI